MSTAIQSVSLDTIREAVTDAIRRGVDTPRLEDFLASVDWSHHEDAGELVRSLLGRLEGWTTQHREGDLSVAEYASNLVTLLEEQLSLSA